MREESTLEMYKPEMTTRMDIPSFEGLRAGFPAEASSYDGKTIDLNSELIRHPESTFFARIKGNSMVDYGIDDGDLAVVDRSLEPTTGRIAVCYINGEFTLKRIEIKKDGLWLMPGNPEFQPLKVREESEFQVWGILIYVIKKF